MPSFKVHAKLHAAKASAPTQPEAPQTPERPAEPVLLTGPQTPATSSTAPAPSKEPLRLGQSIRIVGLQARPELNLVEGVLAGFDEERQRWKVELATGTAKLFKEANIEAYTPQKDPMERLRAMKGRMARRSEPAESPTLKPIPVSRELFPVELDDDIGFLKSIEQCLRESKVMWDEF
mmetsp:Transcript_15113/g.32577  ORF Transcript_15113/g.32577 Transcript_15113/m.32577 type:complete len:178 (-) Transcript_15113:46-579(-)